MNEAHVRKSLHAVAIIETVKGGLVLVAGLGLLGLLHKDVEAIAYELVSRLHLNPAQKYPRIFLDLAAKIEDRELWFFSIMAVIYSTLRFAEGYGLWRDRVWAEWLAVVSGLIYVPIELFEIFEKVTPGRIFALVFNCLVVALVLLVMIRRRKRTSGSSGSSSFLASNENDV